MSYLSRLACVLLAALSAAAHAQIGTVTFKAGDVSIQTGTGAARAATKGSPINEGDTVIVGPVSSAQLKMVDGGVLALRPETQMKFDEYKWSGQEDGRERGLMSLLKGGFRTVTGAIGRLNKNNYKVYTPTATVGIRGTDHEIVHIPVPSGVPLAAAPAPGTYDKVNVGAATITAQGITVVVQSNQVGFAAPAAAPQILPAVPSFMRATAAPRPTQTGGQAQAQQGGQSSGSSSDPVRSSSVVDNSGQMSAASDTAVKAADTTPVAVSTVVAVTPVAASAAGATATTTSAETTTVPILLASSTGTTANLTTQVTTTSTGTTTTIASGVAVIKVNNTLATSYYFWANPGKVFGADDQFRSNTFDGFDSTFAFTGPNGNFTSATGHDEEVVLSGNTAGASAVTTLASGIKFGRYASGSTASAPSGSALLASGKDNSGSYTNREVVGTFQWIYGPEMTPVFASAIKRGTASYSVAGSSLPTDQNNMTGTFSSASLSVDFDKQSVNTSLSVSMPANTFNGGSSTRNWVATANGIKLDDGGGFSAGGSSTVNYAHQNVLVSLNGSTSASGQINGQLTGALDAASLAYTLNGSDPLNSLKHEHVNGVIAFGSPSFSTTAFVPSYLKLTARGSISGLDANTGATSSSNPAAKFDTEYLTVARIVELDAARTKIVGGQLVEFDGRSTIVNVSPNIGAVAPFTCQVNAQCFTSELPTRIGIIAAGSAASGAIPAMPSISGAATVVEQGSDAVTGAIWGRYSNGNFAMVDRITGSPVGSGTTTLGPINHYMLLPQQTSPMVLPTTGSYNYTLVGGTSPTDTSGAVGTLNSATLFADFNAQTVNVSLGATVGGRTWAASASNVSILAKTGFEVSKNASGGSLAVTCAGCTSTQTAGKITGGFGGPTGEAAGIAYSLNAGGVPPGQGGTGVTVGGVAAFRR